MQILQWLSKLTHEPPRVASSSPISQNQDVHDRKFKTKEIVRTRNPKKVEKIKLNCEYLNIFCFLRRRDVSEACFYRTLDLKRLGNIHRREMKMKKEDNINARGQICIITHKSSDCATNHGGNKVLPIANSSEKKDQKCNKGDQKKTVSRMKELMKWAATAKADDHKGGKYIGRKVLHFRNKAACIKTLQQDDDQLRLSNESPKISFKLELENCSTTFSTLYSMGSTPLHLADHGVGRPGSWITTDSEFVVLEL